jgi:DNA modification methylase
LTPYYDQDGVTIYCGDCCEVMATFDASAFDLALTDPPYGVLLGAKPNNQRTRVVSSYASYDDTPENLATLIENTFPQIQRVAKRIVMTPGVRNMWRWPKPTHVGSFYYPAASGCNSWGFSCWQPIFYYGDDPHGGKGSRPDSFMSTEAATPNGHPCPKPVGQWARLLDRCATAGDYVLDPFMGSGTTLVVAKTAGLRCVGIDIEERYCEIAARRLAQGVLFGVA